MMQKLLKDLEDPLILARPVDQLIEAILEIVPGIGFDLEICG